MPPLRHKIRDKIRPATGIAPLLHIAFRIALPIVIFILSALSIGIGLQLLVILLSKWRIFAVKTRFWLPNLRANSIDIIVGISIVVFMAHTGSPGIRLFWAAVYCVWLLLIKPKSTIFAITFQSAIGQLAGLSALFIAWPEGSISGLVLVAGMICFLSARHFFDSYNEPYAKMLSYLWGYFGACVVWVLAHLLVVYPGRDGQIAQPTLFISVIGYTLAAIYYLEHFDKLSGTVKRELLYVSTGAVIVLLVSLFYEGTHLIVG